MSINDFYRSFTFFNVALTIIVLLAFSIAVVVLARRFQRWRKKNQAPRLTMNAKVVAKRISMSYDQKRDPLDNKPVTTFTLAFQVADIGRKEFDVTDQEFDRLDEGTTGKLTFKGTRYIRFERRK